MLLPRVVVVVVVVVVVPCGDGGGDGGGHLRICCLFVLKIFVQDAAAEVAKCFGPVSSPSNIINPKPLSILLSPPNSTPHHHRTSNAGRSSQGATDETCGGGHDSTSEL